MLSETHIAAGRFAHHGGRLGTARALFPDVPQPWIDLSTGISPRPFPAPRASNRARNRLPEPTELARLEAIAGEAFGVTSPGHVIAMPGTECALRLLPHVLKSRAAVIAGPTYGSHADAWMHAGALTETVEIAQLQDHAARAACIVVVNPNNPDGRIIERAQLLSLHDSLAAHGGALVVDEAFAEVAARVSVADIAGTDRAPRLAVLRSFGKFFGLAGVRLGFIVASRSIVAALRELIGEWPISSDAIAAGIAAYSDAAWAERNRALLARAARRLDKLLTSSGCEIVGGTSLFRLVRSPDARLLFARLLSAGILVRPFDHDAALLRFGLPQGRVEWERLAAALSRSS